ncbi:MAG TPA: N-acetyltransferase [Candidatus Faecalibacterium faecipullorum]|uniref:N-acetyltransferase n=1 Tax=Candidatus Faecalibacterium faecipullorum TaxID=2838578 RepID=A0A9D2S752_9FIRM|nr:N-acetyltransferase [Candidatus Faecalibacterium faecipullorum]
MEYRVISNRITAVENDQVLGEITFPVCGPETVVIDHTWVDPSLRGQGTAGQLMQAVVDKLRADGRKAQATCSYARGWFAKHPEAADVLADDWCDGPEACRLRF